MPRYTTCTYGLYLCTTAFLTYYQLSAEGLVILVALMVADVGAGIAKSHVLKEEGKEWFSTDKFKDGVVAKLLEVIVVVFFAVIVGFITFSPELTETLVDIILGLLIVAEFVSVLQNTMMVRQKKYIPEWDAVTHVLSFLLGLLKKAIESKTKE